MRGIGRLILAHRAGLDDDARDTELRDCGQRLCVHVLREHVVFQIRSQIPMTPMAGIWWSIPIGWFIADVIGIIYYKQLKKETAKEVPAP